LKRDKIIETRWFGGRKTFVSKRKYLIVYPYFNSEPVKRLEKRGYMRGFRGSDDGMSWRILDEWKTV